MSVTPLAVALVMSILVAAVLTAMLRDVLAATIAFSAYSLVLSLLWVLLRAPDVALTEAAVGAGLLTVLFVATISQTTRRETGLAVAVRWPALFVMTAFGALFARTLVTLPPVGAADSPVQGHLAEFYLGTGLTEAGITNVVIAVLVFYRGFEMFGEVVVVLAAGIGALLVLGRQGIGIEQVLTRRFERIDESTGDPSIVATTAIRAVTPFVALFGLYITFYGTKAAGGGFQGGVIIGAAVILLAFGFGIERARDWLNRSAVTAITIGGITAIALLGLGSQVFGGQFLEYEAIPLPSATFYGVKLVELGICATVAGIAILFFFALVPQGKDTTAKATTEDGGECQ